MARKRGNLGVMAIKIDLEKAYDCVEWSFIRDTLALVKFPKHLISLIMSCVSSSSISMLFNGGALEPFHPSRGIRQGDPLSPYLFIMCMEILRALILEKCEAKLWKPMMASRGGIAFSCLFFADDLVLFAKADHKNFVAIKDVLDTFCALSGQKVSVEKSRVFFLLMSLLVPEKLLVIFWNFAPPLLSKSIGGFPSSMLLSPNIYGLSLSECKVDSLVGNLTSYPFQADWF